MLVAYIKDPQDIQPNEQPVTTATSAVPLPLKHKYGIICCAGLYQMFGIAVEWAFGQFLPTFVIKALNFSKTDSALLSSFFWIFYTSSLVLAAILLFKLSMFQIMVSSYTIYLAASLSMILFVQSHPVAIWPLCALLAFGLSPYYGNAFSWANQFIILDRVGTSILSIFMNVGTTIPPVSVSPFIASDPIMFLYYNFAMCIVLGIMVFCLRSYGNYLLNRGYKYQPAPQVDPQEEKPVITA